MATLNQTDALIDALLKALDAMSILAKENDFSKRMEVWSGTQEEISELLKELSK